MTLKEFKKIYSLSFAELTALTGVGRTHLCKYLNGSRVPSLKNAYKIEVGTKGKVKMEEWLNESK